MQEGVPKLPMRMSVDEFLAWSPRDGRAWQLVDGLPEAMAPANRTHGAIQNQIGHLMAAHLSRSSGPCSVITAPGIVPRAQAGHNLRVPDLAVTCSGYTSEEPTLADPVLVIEILSPSNQAETWANVWTYTTIPSVQEILVLRTVSVGPSCCVGSRTEPGPSGRWWWRAASWCWTASVSGSRWRTSTGPPACADPAGSVSDFGGGSPDEA